MTAKKSDKETGPDAVARNRKARRDYLLLETFEAGLVLEGSEVKSIRNRKVSIDQAYGRIINDELYIVGMHIAEYEQAGPFGHKPLRPRKLLLHKREIREITAKILQKGVTLVPLRVHFRHGYAKVEMAIATGKRKFDKREDIKKRDAQRDMQRALRHHKR